MVFIFSTLEKARRRSCVSISAAGMGFWDQSHYRRSRTYAAKPRGSRAVVWRYVGVLVAGLVA